MISTGSILLENWFIVVCTNVTFFECDWFENLKTSIPALVSIFAPFKVIAFMAFTVGGVVNYQYSLVRLIHGYVGIANGSHLNVYVPRRSSMGRN